MRIRHGINVCSGKSVRLSAIAAILQQECKSNLPIRIKNDGEKLPYTANNTRLLTEIKTITLTDLQTGIRKLWDFWNRKYQEEEEFHKQIDSFIFD